MRFDDVFAEPKGSHWVPTSADGRARTLVFGKGQITEPDVPWPVQGTDGLWYEAARVLLGDGRYFLFPEDREGIKHRVAVPFDADPRPLLHLTFEDWQWLAGHGAGWAEIAA